MSRRLTITIIFLIMLKATLHHIKSHETNFDRRETLVKTLTNAEKLARTRERSKFLVSCRRKYMTSKSCVMRFM